MQPQEISAGARTVVQVAEHFQRLKSSAQLLVDTFGASRRGYFTPTEDEEVRHLLVSYWQARNALIELVAAFHADASLPDELRPAAFLVAYAGALVLIDAARFLRECCHDRPVVRGKLNEPEPHFGIPVGTYDTIQKSLTSPVHAWQLYHAVRYYAEHEPQLRALAASQGLEPLLDIVNRLQDRLNVSPDSFTIARLRVRARWAATGVQRDVLTRALYGLQRAASKLISDVYTVPHYHPVLPPAVCAELRELLRPGDVLITRKEHALTNYFLPGFWPHAALFLGEPRHFEELEISQHANVQPRWARLLECDPQEPRRVLEAMKDGVWIRSLSSPLGSDALAVLRPQLPRPQIAEALARGLFHDGKPYDFDFDFTRSDRMVCTEVVYRSYEGIGGISFPLTRRAGRLTLAAMDLIQMSLDRAHFEPVAAYVPAHADHLLRGPAAEDALRRTVVS